jgi:hypothetical protein
MARWWSDWWYKPKVITLLRSALADLPLVNEEAAERELDKRKSRFAHKRGKNRGIIDVLLTEMLARSKGLDAYRDIHVQREEDHIEIFWHNSLGDSTDYFVYRSGQDQFVWQSEILYGAT